MSRRVVVTGVGLVTPLAIGTEESWRGLLEGRSGIGPITRFDHTNFATHFAGEVKDFDPSKWITSREAKTVDRFIQFAIAAGAMAMEDAGLSKFEGEAMACRVFVRPVNGFTPRRNIIDLTNESALTVWIARLQPDLPPVPVKLDMDTDLGAIRAHIANARRGTDEVPLGRAERKS